MTIGKFLDNTEEYFCAAAMAVMTILVFVQVVMRYVFANSLSWSEELARYIFLWLSWVGASYAVRERAHFRVEMFAGLLKGKARIALEYFVLFAWFVASALLTYYGTQMVLFLIDTGQFSPAMDIPMEWPYACLPVGCAMMSIRLAIEIYKLHKNGLPEPPAAG